MCGGEGSGDHQVCGKEARGSRHACQVGGLPCPRGTPVSHTCGALTQPVGTRSCPAHPVRSTALPHGGDVEEPEYRARQLLHTGPLTHLHLGARAAVTPR